jgi:hypothetical protein
MKRGNLHQASADDRVLPHTEHEPRLFMVTAGETRPTQPQLTQKAIVALGPLLPRFAQTMELGAPLKVALAKAVEADEPAGKRLARAKMLHNVLSAKYPNVKLDDAAKMTAEWVHGVLDASYPAESAVVDGKFSDSDSATYDALLALLDGAQQWVCELVGAFELAGRIQRVEPPQSPLGGDATEGAAKVDMAAVIERAFASGATLHEVAPAAVPEAEVLGLELWEALCWRRGALRFYRASAAISERLAAGRSDARDRAAVGRAAAPCAPLIDVAVGALQQLLRARGTDGGGSGGAAVRNGSALTLRYGVYSDTLTLTLTLTLALTLALALTLTLTLALTLALALTLTLTLTLALPLTRRLQRHAPARARLCRRAELLALGGPRRRRRQRRQRRQRRSRRRRQRRSRSRGRRERRRARCERRRQRVRSGRRRGGKRRRGGAGRALLVPAGGGGGAPLPAGHPRADGGLRLGD